MSVEATSALLKVSQTALRGAPWDYLVHVALERVRQVTSCDVAAFYAASRTDGALSLQERQRRETGLEALPPSDRFLVRVAAGDDTGPLVAGPGRHDLAIPVRGGTETFGVLAAAMQHEPFGAADKRFLAEMAEVLSLAVRAERRRRASEIVAKQQRYAFENNPNPMLLLDAETFRYIDVNQTAIDAYGYTREQFLQMTPYDLRAPGHTEGLEATFNSIRREATTVIDTVHRKADGTPIDVHITSITVEGSEGKIRIATIQDMTERNEALARALASETQLAHDLLHDRLTGLPNRVLFNERLSSAIERARGTDKMAAVLFIDIDEFKTVNDTMGHPAGDALLKEIADRLRSATRRLDCIARVGGDEFIAVLCDISEIDHVSEVVRKLERVAADPVRLPGGDIRVTCSIGVALFPHDGDDAESLIRNADTAMYQAKREGRSTSCFFTPAMQHEAEQRMRLEARLRKAIEDGAFQLAYQPIYALDGTLLAAEALIRWPQADGTKIPPNLFIPYAEACGLIVPIGNWVLRTACMQNAGWSRQASPLMVSVNVSAKQLADPHFVRTVEQALAESGLDPKLLELELTETVMSTNLERTAAVVQTLRGRGVRFAIDDFGTGYNSLATLRSNVVDTLKLDMCFVANIATSAVDQAIASAVITAAHGLGAKVVAEGVETPAQRAMLASLKCDAAQGHLFARPMSHEQFGELLRSLAQPRTSGRVARTLQIVS
ncbi:MAG TPA: EAL domain-containing protein [Candidatus Elarobacter sp.]|jgi:diguanylate cyclase (GGDEF)-like protein/PAS domain S-box-containing protein|nr:EAL domain-containing protein [Candidatus Elarobacter sp.]